ncbi:AC4 protein [Blechum interveinal chlorosis virus]|uniref:AC4 protein n=1 Tax=Blechum interveinal chlorosis virus TaxID=1246650 RepID=K4NUJ7_9GEMI|nr:AC4 protein [Blechum interveinal chlorosis virus]AFV48343.1 AC4 protein [Blechum interveinal chlorosis virus]
MKMGNHICTCLSSLRGNTTARITDSSTWYPQSGQHISIRTFRELNPAPTSSPTSARMEIQLTGENSRSTAELLEEVNIQLMMLQQRH